MYATCRFSFDMRKILFFLLENKQCNAIAYRQRQIIFRAILGERNVWNASCYAYFWFNSHFTRLRSGCGKIAIQKHSMLIDKFHLHEKTALDIEDHHEPPLLPFVCHLVCRVPTMWHPNHCYFILWPPKYFFFK